MLHPYSTQESPQSSLPTLRSSPHRTRLPPSGLLSIVEAATCVCVTPAVLSVLSLVPHASLFLLRLPLPEPWRGLRDEALDQVSGIPGCIFVHASGFIGGHHTREGALSMARATLAQRPAPVPLAKAAVQ